ncbi:MAG: signal peptidase II [Coriobacteriia bacterium]|nr:signal peptidase II [Coriobacteriia bacterium]
MRRNAAVLVCVALAVLLADQLSKHHFDSWFPVGAHMGGPFLGLFQFTLVHNQGAAWGLFSGSMVPLGIFSLVVCALILVYLFKLEPESSLPEVLGLSLVFAGGIGNAIDRFMTGYVVDFIDVTFMDFPVFNIADIGVTCGIVLFLVSFIVFGGRRERQREQAEGVPSATLGAEGEGVGSVSSRESGSDK